MNGSSAKSFWQAYFTATQHVLPSWLARLSAAQRVGMLNELMQWEVTARRPVDPDSNRHV
ncbi:glucose uptake inhibitor SgrT [Siccibacter turicensis]|uniref:Glucose uptake inhibitor SgrT n=1 Tax=Siccibacter turicensis TaxID=357233 RepID=A0A2P8VH74_9ENTR|nr:glucose uptake inhibitor SgrT [Siccibacter turicensis]MDY0971531.1 glucose uptake inhibitor SgrT [Siccibacter turicensis]PSN06893.1 glucose uptake inhibitor SgrT [Siccibacter turicensis]